MELPKYLVLRHMLASNHHPAVHLEYPHIMHVDLLEY